MFLSPPIPTTRTQGSRLAYLLDGNIDFDSYTTLIGIDIEVIIQDCLH